MNGSRWIRSLHKFDPAAKYTAMVLLVWTALIAASLGFYLQCRSGSIKDLARYQARSALQKDLAYQNWNTGHNGVYVFEHSQIDENQPAAIKGIEHIQTTDGQCLALVTPAQMTRQASLVNNRLSGFRTRLCSLNPLNDLNKADGWEAQALKNVSTQSMSEVCSIEQIDGQPYMRLLKPLFAQGRCLECHKPLGAWEGELLGGVSVSVPMEPLQAASRTPRLYFLLAHFFLWCVGALGIVWVAVQMKKRARENNDIQRQLEQSRLFLQEVLDTVPESVMVTDMEMNITLVNRSAKRAWQVEAGQKACLHCNQLFSANSRMLCEVSEKACPFRKACASDQTYNLLTLQNKANGVRRVWDVSASAITDGLKRKRYVLMVGHDVTGQVESENTIRNHLHFLETLINTMPNPVFYKDPHGVFLGFNQAFSEHVVGMPADKILGRTLHELALDMPGRVEASFIERDQQALLSRQSQRYQTRLICADGQVRTFLVSKACFCDGDGKLGGLVGVMMDLTELQQAHEAVDRMSRAIEATAEGIVVTDLDGNIQSVNPGFLAITGYREDEVLGQNPRVLKSGKTPGELYEDMWAAVTNGQVWQGDLVNKRKDGSLYYAALTVSPIHGETGRIEGYVGVQRDVTQQLRAQKEIELKNRALDEALLATEQALAEAEAATVAKSEFLANMSHEIRTPMNGIVGMTGLLLKTALNEEQMEFAQTVQTCSEALLTLINDILDFSKIEAGKLQFESIPFDLSQVIEEVLDILSPLVHKKGLELIYDLSDRAPTQLVGDPGRLRQILLNLSNNALKFTEQGEIVIRCWLQGESDSVAMLHFSVQDTGIGIAPQNHHRLFQLFSQVDASTTRRFGGTGLGLAICKQLVEMMGGEIGVQSAPGEGSTFWFTVQLQKQLAVQPHQSVQIRDLSGRRVLVVDDNATNRRVLTENLSTWGCDCGEVCGGPQALIELRRAAQAQQPYELALLDMHMPEMDGKELGALIKGDEELRRTILVMLTSLGECGDIAEIRRIGFAAYLTKPIKPGHLCRGLLAVLNHEERRPMTTDSHEVTTPEIKLPAPAAPRAPVRILLAEDNLVNRKVAMCQLGKLGYKVDAVGNGREALTAVQKSDYDLVLMDCQMPEMDGYEATEQIRRLAGELAAIPIIAMTAHAMSGDREKCLEAGMDDYISKPCRVDELSRTIRRWLGVKTEVRTEAEIEAKV